MSKERDRSASMFKIVVFDEFEVFGSGYWGIGVFEKWDLSDGKCNSLNYSTARGTKKNAPNVNTRNMK